MFKGVLSVVLSNCKHSVFKGLLELRYGVGALLFEPGFDLSEEMLDRIEVRGVGGQVKQLALSVLNQFSHLMVVVDGEVIHDDDLSSFECRYKRVFDVR